MIAKNGDSATFYGAGGGGGGCAYIYNHSGQTSWIKDSGGSGYQGVVYVLIPT